jgi:hypothetical protein
MLAFAPGNHLVFIASRHRGMARVIVLEDRTERLLRLDCLRPLATAAAHSARRAA